MPARRFTLFLSVALAAAAFDGAHAQVTENSKAAGLDQCVEETGFMRRYHMDVLVHQRDRTMREGIRTRDHSLVECVSCHAGRDDDGNFAPVNAEGQFCEGCHTRVAVSIDCFQCHATKPEPDAGSAQAFSKGYPVFALNTSDAGAQYCLKTN